MAKICWLCKSNLADSREHTYKKSLLKLASFNKEDGKPFRFSFNEDSKRGSLQGPDAGMVKHGKTICVSCNGSHSQPWDKAYDEFTHFIITKKVDPNFFDFNQIFSTNVSENIKNLRNYYIKSLGCTLTDAGFILPDNFPNPLTENNLNQYHVTICWSHAAQRFLEDVADYAKCSSEILSDANILGRGTVQCSYSKSFYEATGNKQITNAVWWESVGKLFVTHWFNITPALEFGPILEPSVFVYALTESYLSREELEQKMQGII